VILRQAINLSVWGMTMKEFGIHLLIELWSCNRRKIDDLHGLERIMSQAATVAGAHVLKTAFQDFNPQGVSGVVVIAESHLTIHTWPEHGYAAVDIFTCGAKVDPWKAVDFLKKELEAEGIQVRDFKRGILDQVEESCPDYAFVKHAACGNTNC
jgi:S-adenosylmethionine decarboxylase